MVDRVTVFRFVCLLFIGTRASDCLERLVPEMTYYVSRWTLNSAHSLTLLDLLAGQAERLQGQAATVPSAFVGSQSCMTPFTYWIFTADYLHTLSLLVYAYRH